MNPPKTCEFGNAYFEYLIKTVRPIIETEGISLDFSGYAEVISAYAELQEDDEAGAWTLAKTINGWSEYISSVANLIQKLFLDAETDKLAIQSVCSIRADSTKVANGERLANQDKLVIEARKKRNILKAFYDELIAKSNFLERAYYHCKSTSDISKKQMVAINEK